MIILNAVILFIVIFEVRLMYKQGFKKEIIAYFSILIIVIVVEILAISIHDRKSLSVWILNAMGLMPIFV
jgi:hypothetical protein